MNRVLASFFVMMAIFLGTLGIAVIIMSFPLSTRHETTTTILVHMQPLDWIGILRGFTSLGASILILRASWLLYAAKGISANSVIGIEHN
ncbi:MAG: hypothetical protein RL368_1433 [Pseudomonadota bacterium]|jgi:hypothetical protein